MPSIWVQRFDQSLCLLSLCNLDRWQAYSPSHLFLRVIILKHNDWNTTVICVGFFLWLLQTTGVQDVNIVLYYWRPILNWWVTIASINSSAPIYRDFYAINLIFFSGKALNYLLRNSLVNSKFKYVYFF